MKGKILLMVTLEERYKGETGGNIFFLSEIENENDRKALRNEKASKL